LATTMNKNKVSDMAKDFGLTSKDILSVLSTYEDGSKKPSQVLSADEVNLIFEHLTQKHQVKIESIYAESAPQKKPEPKAAPAPAQNQPKANNAQNQPRNNNGGSRFLHLLCGGGSAGAFRAAGSAGAAVRVGSDGRFPALEEKKRHTLTHIGTKGRPRRIPRTAF
jgi:hypothetical protein